MIKITRLNGTELYINCEHIETIEATPDTVITTIHGKIFVVKESISDIIDRTINYKNKIFNFESSYKKD